MGYQIRTDIIFFVVYFIILVISAAPSQKFISIRENEMGREFPYLVSILKDGEHNCGGAIIDEWNILTAAHCVDRSIKSNLIRQLTVRTGSDNIYHGGMLYKVCRGVFYPGFEHYRVDSKPNDIAVITLCQPIIFNKDQNKINLPRTDFVDNTTATVAGWGYKHRYERILRTIVKKHTPRIIHSNFCKPYANYKLYKGHLCGIHENQYEQGTCKGDSGSPLVVDNEIIGIVSWGAPNCNAWDPDVYTNVVEYLDFINLVKNNVILN